MDEKKFQGVDEKLVKLIKEAISSYDKEVIVTEGLRTKERQLQLFKEKKTKTLNSKHLLGKAVDVAIKIDGSITWKFDEYKKFAEHVKALALLNNIPINCGADWGWDGPHIELQS